MSAAFTFGRAHAGLLQQQQQQRSAVLPHAHVAPGPKCLTTRALKSKLHGATSGPALSRAPRQVAAAAGGSSSGPVKKLDKVFDTVIVGAGISGLVTAQALAAKHGISNFLVTESRERVGGNITSLEGNGYVWEEGPNSFQPNDSMLQIAVSRECSRGVRSFLASCHSRCDSTGHRNKLFKFVRVLRPSMSRCIRRGHTFACL